MLTKQKVLKIQKVLEKGLDERMPLIFSALGDPGRYKIFKLLTKKQDVCVTDVASILGISVPAASQQLKILERTGLVRKIRDGQVICYVVKKDDPVIESIIKVLN